MTPNQRIRPSPGLEWFDPGLLNERILLLVFESIKWDLQALCRVSEVSRKLRAIAKRILWRQLCLYRAPRMVTSLMNGASSSRVAGGWPALAKLMFFCCGSEPTRHFSHSHRLPGHFIKTSRFSKTSGRSFLPKRCQSDLLYVSDPCEHQLAAEEDDIGVYRGVFKGFMNSKTRAVLIRRQMALEDRVCPFCNARVWSMTAARLIPKSAVRRLGSHDGKLEYFVCVNGHLHGTCWLIPLSSDEDADLNEDVDDDNDEENNGYIGALKGIERMASGSTSSTGEEIIGERSTEPPSTLFSGRGIDMSRASPAPGSALNPNATPFMPLVYQTVEDYSDQWWALVQSSPWFRDYWLQDRFSDPQDDSFDDLVSPTSILSSTSCISFNFFKSMLFFAELRLIVLVLDGSVYEDEEEDEEE